jgi:hypothetical protein
MLIGGLLKVIVHTPGWLRSMLNCEWSGMSHFLLSSKELAQTECGAKQLLIGSDAAPFALAKNPTAAI